MNYLGVNLTKYVWNLCAENCTMLMKLIEKDKTNEETHCVNWLETKHSKDVNSTQNHYQIPASFYVDGEKTILTLTQKGKGAS